MEVARQHGLYEEAHEILIAAKGGPWQKRIAQLVKRVPIPHKEMDDAITASRYEQQIAKDLTAGPGQFAVDKSPHLSIAGRPYGGPYTREALMQAFQAALLAKSL